MSRYEYGDLSLMAQHPGDCDGQSGYGVSKLDSYGLGPVG